MIQTSDIQRSLINRRPGYSLDQLLYSSPEAFAADLEHIFYKQWLFAAPECDIPSTGDYITYKVGAYSVIILRDGDGHIRAFHNTCRHRGSVICTKAKGSNPKLVCPYHQWTYDLDGRLIFARDMGDDFDLSTSGLHPVHCKTSSSMIYICLDDNPPEFETFRQEVEPYLAPHALQDAKVAYETTSIEHGNWKLVFENNRECYHCSANHPALCRSFPEDPAGVTDDPGGADAGSIFHNNCAAHGLKSVYRIEDRGTWRVSRVPLVHGAESYTMDGTAAATKKLGTVPGIAGALLLFRYPILWSHFLTDHAVLFRATPLGPNETELTTKWLVHKDAQEGVDYDLKKLTEVWDQTNAEDKYIVELNQQGVNSPAYTPGPYSVVHENGTNQFVDWYCDHMISSLSPATLAAE